jgi:hypothetical protein
MKPNSLTRGLLIAIPLLFAAVAAMVAAPAPVEPATATPGHVARLLGFTDAEIHRIEAGDVISKSLNEGSDKELAGVASVFVNKPIGALLDLILSGKMLQTDNDIRAFGTFTSPDAADEALILAGLSADEAAEARNFANATPGDKLNLSTAEIAQFRDVRATPEAVSVRLRAMLKARYVAYLHNGLQGIEPYARWRGDSSPSAELALAIHETLTATPRKDFLQALLDYPADSPTGVEHHFYWYKQTVQDRPTFILAHVAQRHSDNAALMTEEQFYVGHSYNSNFIAAGGLEVDGGTLVFYVNRTFTDQVAGFGSGLKHNVGRGQMLDDAVAKLKRMRDELRR